MKTRALAISAASLVWTAAAIAQQRAINIEKSVMVVRVYKAGMFSAVGHDHEIAAPIAGGAVDTAARSVELRANAGALRVRDPHVSGKDQAEIQTTMLGPEVLDAERYPEIIFRSTAAEQAGVGSWRVQGQLTLHGQTRTVVVDAQESGGSYAGSIRLKLTDFGFT